MSAIFNIISLLYVFRSVQLLIQIVREWADIVQEPLTQRKKSLAEQASFFIAVPIGVLFHELGHALAVWFFGGTVVSFNFRFFWGEVEHFGIYTPPERWIISLAGTIGSLLFGILIWLLLRSNKTSSLRYFGLRAFRFQIYFALLYYPIFTAIFSLGGGFIGDWVTIYNFALTPILSGTTLVIHVVFLILYWQYDKKGSFEAPAMASIAQQSQFDELERQVELNPHNPQLQMQYIDMLRRGGAQNRAKTQLKRYLKENPHSAEAHLQLAAIEANKQGSKKSRQYAQKALDMGLSNPFQKATAYHMIAKYNMAGGTGDAAIQAYNQAIAALKSVPATPQQSIYLANLYRERSLAYRRLQKYELAYNDISQAISLAQQSGQPDLAATYQEDLAVLENHAGHKFGVPSQQITND